MDSEYRPEALRSKWQAYWEAHKTFRQPNPGEPGFDASKPKFYALDMFPYPSGSGLHVGHPEGYTATGILSRYRRMCGYNVLHPMGWDAFGLPAEQHAVETGRHPAITTDQNVATFRRQLKMLGFCYDWDREISTTDPEYYRWTQWIFLKLFNSWYDNDAQRARPIEELSIPGDISTQGERAIRDYVDGQRLAYLAEVPVNWCPALGTVLSNEEVTNDGKSDRGNHQVVRRPLRQWMLRITKYADRLGEDLDGLDWPESVKIMQRNWIGRSEGAEVDFKIDGSDSAIRVYTTRPDTLFGATYMVLAPEHPLVEKIATAEQKDAVRQYCDVASKRSDLARTADAKEKTGVFTGAYAVNPVWGAGGGEGEGDTNARIPIWVADYVLIGYGTGAIMCVPGHDSRDFEFAQQFHLPIRAVVMPKDGWLKEHCKVLREEPHEERCEEHCGEMPIEELRKQYIADCGRFPEAFCGEGQAINSQRFDGLSTAEFQQQINAWLSGEGLGHSAVNYKLRDWLFSRQRYWGEPFPILHGPDGELVALDESELPLTLPEVDDYRPTTVADDSDAMPEPPLGRAKDWLTVERDGKTYRRELNTMPQWAGSCWYYLRFLDPRNKDRFCSEEAERYWMAPNEIGGKKSAGGIDLYLGGAEHAVLHLLYARFWHKVLFDLGYVSTKEPFAKLYNQGMIRSFAYTDSRGIYIGYDDIDFRDDRGAYHKETGEKLSGGIEKMSKSMKNVINPEVVVHESGSDALRLYEMFMGPLDASKPWNPRDVPGVFRFLQRTWRLIAGEGPGGLSTMIAMGEVNADLERVLHKTIKKVTDDLERMAFNTAISAMMEFVNEAYRAKSIHKTQAERFVLLLSPFAPHLCEELWQRLRGDEWKESLAMEAWPTFDASLVVDDQIEIPVQVNGKVAGRITIAKDASQDDVERAAFADGKVKAKLGDSTIVKKIYIPGRMLNVVVKK